MDEQGFVTVLLRMVERILTVGIAGMTVYFGYRLFLLLPTETNAEGKIELPNVSVVLSKVGPGVFFVAFAVFVLYTSLTSPIKTDGKFEGQSQRGGASDGVQAPIANVATPPDTGRVRQDMRVLNCVQSVLTGGAGGIGSDDLDRAIRDAKAALLRGPADAANSESERLPGCAERPAPARPR